MYGEGGVCCGETAEKKNYDKRKLVFPACILFNSESYFGSLSSFFSLLAFALHVARNASATKLIAKCPEVHYMSLQGAAALNSLTVNSNIFSSYVFLDYKSSLTNPYALPGKIKFSVIHFNVLNTTTLLIVNINI